jgi:6-phosphogluconate dehydrogenase
MEQPLAELGMIGLGVMGRSLVLNLADHGFPVAGYDKDLTKGQALLDEGAGKPVQAAESLADFVRRLKPPRVVMLLIAPVTVVDIVIRDLAPLLGPGDLIIDACNSHFKDTDRRAALLADKQIRFFGMGISGGEAGARHGPSLMPGGPRQEYERVRPMLEAVTAHVGGEPCVTWVGNGSAGHYVKMVHNGIEYGIMQMIAETYDLLQRGLGLNNDQLHVVYDQWNRGELNSYLLEITAKIFLKPDERTSQRLVDTVLDVARQKGTGKWTSQDALDLFVPLPTIDAAVFARVLSGAEKERKAFQETYPAAVGTVSGDRDAFIRQLGQALYAATAITYAQGLDLLRHASEAYKYGLNLADIARIWRGGCIIRAAMLEDIRAAYAAHSDLPNLLLDGRVADRVKARQNDLRSLVRTAIDLGIPAPALTMSLCYLDSFRSGHLPANLIQAQRDCFGAHTYERIDAAGAFHTHWEDV